MTKVVYILTDGTKVYSYAQAQASGQKYTVRYEPIPKPEVKLTEKQRANRVKAIVRQPPHN